MLAAAVRRSSTSSRSVGELCPSSSAVLATPQWAAFPSVGREARSVSVYGPSAGNSPCQLNVRATRAAGHSTFSRTPAFGEMQRIWPLSLPLSWSVQPSPKETLPCAPTRNTASSLAADPGWNAELSMYGLTSSSVITALAASRTSSVTGPVEAIRPAMAVTASIASIIAVSTSVKSSNGSPAESGAVAPEQAASTKDAVIRTIRCGSGRRFMRLIVSVVVRVARVRAVSLVPLEDARVVQSAVDGRGGLIGIVDGQSLDSDSRTLYVLPITRLCGNFYGTSCYIAWGK